MALPAAEPPVNELKSWIMDSGATISATNDPADCIEISACNVSVTAAGCTFSVSQRGTAVIHAADRAGALQPVHIENCLISARFPFKLLSLQSFAKKGFTITMTGEQIVIGQGGAESLEGKLD